MKGLRHRQWVVCGYPNALSWERKRFLTSLMILKECFEEYLSDEYKTFRITRNRRTDIYAHTTVVCGKRRDTLSVFFFPTFLPLSNPNPIHPKKILQFIRGFLAEAYFGIEKTSQLIHRIKGEPNLRLWRGFMKCPVIQLFRGHLHFCQSGLRLKRHWTG